MKLAVVVALLVVGMLQAQTTQIRLFGPNPQIAGCATPAPTSVAALVVLTTPQGTICVNMPASIFTVVPPATVGASATLTINALNPEQVGIMPSGALNGANATFTLPNPPNPPSSLKVMLNGLRLKLVDSSGRGDYTLSGSTITFVAGAIPQAGDELLADFRF